MNVRDSRGRRLAQALPLLRLAAAIGVVTAASAACGGGATSSGLDAALLAQGQKILRFDTFGDESQWTTKLPLHEVVGTELSPAQSAY
jgi:hypothetical protein